MKKSSFLDISTKRSPMTEQMTLSNGGEKRGSSKKDLGLALPLTSLIDAFSIIVIYLLIGTQNGGMETEVKGMISLPTADRSTAIDTQFPTLRIENGKYYIDDKQVSEKNLVAELSKVKQNSNTKDLALMIQADTKMKYSDLDPLIKAGSLAGIEKLKFAVVPSK